MVNSLQDSGSDIDGLIDIDSIYTKVSAPKKKLGDIITNVKQTFRHRSPPCRTRWLRWLRLCKMIRVCLCSLMSKRDNSDR